MSFLSSSAVQGPFFRPTFSQHGCLPMAPNQTAKTERDRERNEIIMPPPGFIKPSILPKMTINPQRHNKEEGPCFLIQVTMHKCRKDTSRALARATSVFRKSNLIYCLCLTWKHVKLMPSKRSLGQFETSYIIYVLTSKPLNLKHPKFLFIEGTFI